MALSSTYARLPDAVDDDDEANGGRVDEEPPKQPRRSETCWSMAVFLLAALSSLLTVLLLLAIGLLDGSDATAVAVLAGEIPADSVAVSTTPTTSTPSPEPTSFRRPDADYMLDPAWDVAAPPTVRAFSWVLTNAEANPDGVFRPMLLINGKFPGELIRCNEGDTIVVEVENRAVNATAIHWHGLFQNGTNHMDGTPGATQCPIAPGRSFRYEFTVKGQTGTYFYHGHQGAEALDGLVGPVVVHGRDEATLQRLPYTSDRIVLVQDWYHDPAAALVYKALEPGAEAAPLPNGALINGANVVDCDTYMAEGRRCDNATSDRATLDLAAGAAHRLRLIHVGAFAWLEITLDRHHALTVTEVDGVDVEPSPERSILMAPGQRYSIIVTANDTSEPDRAYWLRTRIVTHCFSENALAGRDEAVALAVVRYTGDGNTTAGTTADPARMPTTVYDNGAYTVLCRDMHTAADHEKATPFRPVSVRPAPAVADHAYFFRLNLEIHDYRLQRGYFNASSYRPNLPSPALHRVVDGLHAGNMSFAAEGVNDVAFDTTELVLAHRTTRIIDLAIQSFDEGAHPLHLHGHQVFALAQGRGPFPGYAALGLQPAGRGVLDPSTGSIGARLLANAMRRDVATVEGFGWALLRIVLDNAGVWKLHCHMVWHGDGGMAMLLLSRTDDLQKATIPAANRALCDVPVEELVKGAVPDDRIWWW